MNDLLQILETILVSSCKKHGAEKPLTIGHLHNIVKMAIDWQEKLSDLDEKEHRELMNSMNPHGQW